MTSKNIYQNLSYFSKCKTKGNKTFSADCTSGECTHEFMQTYMGQG